MNPLLTAGMVYAHVAPMVIIKKTPTGYDAYHPLNGRVVASATTLAAVNAMLDRIGYGHYWRVVEE